MKKMTLAALVGLSLVMATSGVRAQTVTVFMDNFANGVVGDSDSVVGFWSANASTDVTVSEDTSGGNSDLVVAVPNPSGNWAGGQVASAVSSDFELPRQTVTMRVTGLELSGDSGTPLAYRESRWGFMSNSATTPFSANDAFGLEINGQNRVRLGYTMDGESAYPERTNALITTTYVYTPDSYHTTGFELILTPTTYDLKVFYDAGDGVWDFNDTPSFSGTHNVPWQFWGNSANGVPDGTGYAAVYVHGRKGHDNLNAAMSLRVDQIEITTVTIPEPAGLVIAALGGLFLALRRRGRMATHRTVLTIGLIAFASCVLCRADALQFQAGVSPDASYDHLGETIMEGGTENHGNLLLGHFAAAALNDMRNVLSFDVSAVPSGSEITAVNLVLTVPDVSTGSSGTKANLGDVYLYELQPGGSLANELNADVNWSIYRTGTAWSTAGGDLGTLLQIVANGDLGWSIGETTTFDSAALVSAAQGALDDSRLFQVILQAPFAEGNTTTVYNRYARPTDTALADRPLLELTYVIPEPGAFVLLVLGATCTWCRRRPARPR